MNFDSLSAFVDADWGSCHDARGSTTGLVLKVNGAPGYWASNRQSLDTLSSAEADYVAFSTFAKHVLWFRKLFAELSKNGPNPNISVPPTTISLDNTTTISLVKSPLIFERNKYIEIKAHYAKESLENKTVSLVLVKGDIQPADICTKSISKDVLKNLHLS